ncbi:MAG: winged helix DNA-binding protein, partial [Acidimicrobiaceae bacterium]|nr:winged helix DNA-binding protein [Acidimicrobiaceae bacterium]
ELLAAEQISQPGMTSLVGRMAAAGLVTREADPTDGRATLVTVTPAGKAYLDRVHDARAAVIAERVRRLPRPDQQAIAGALNAIDALTRPVLEGDQLP